MPDFQPDIKAAYYSHTGDIIAIALAVLLASLIGLSSVRKKNIRIGMMNGVLILVLIAAVAHIFGQRELLSFTPNVKQIYILRSLNYVLLSCTLLLYVLYLFEPLWIPHKRQKRIIRSMSVLMILTFFADIAASVFGFGFRINERGTVTSKVNLYLIFYVLTLGWILYALFRYRTRLIPRVFWSIVLSIAISVSLLLMQTYFGNLSYTTLAYLLPSIGLIFTFHANPYDVATGAVSEGYFFESLNDCIEKKRRMHVISCVIFGFDEQMRTSKEYRTSYVNFVRNFVRRGVLYRFSDGRLVLTLRAGQDEDDDRALLDNLLEAFLERYRKYKQDYQIVMFETTPEITSVQDYTRLVQYVSRHTPNNTIRRINDDDIKAYFNSRYILSQLEDIAQKSDLDDPRVLVFCQPVYNLQKKRFDTAEALMRLRLEKTGMVFPDQFIPLAEQHGLIHSLTRIILNKTCAAIRDFIEEGYIIRRVSVNFSVADLRYEQFCTEVEHIIDRHNIPYDSIAVEITESRSDDDFNLLKEKVEELQKLGIKFYLDDFGTGYSNFERIMEIPFDIIKFDRSMLLEFARSDASRYMVNTFAEMFNTLQYSVLFEGVETEDDEQNCIGMNAKFLQGYKYSRPIPIADLRNFLIKDPR